ncbi:hypothetical protein HDU80_006302 [Chytriomyces hyalinus]|nr:hypothetical protein HDU80_006302 [Chytriomyces hyalinus]
MNIVLAAVVVVICSIAASAVAAWREHQRVQKLRREDSLRGPRRRVLNPATAIASSTVPVQSTITPPTMSKERESLYRDDIAPMKSHQPLAYTSFSASTPLAASLDRTLAHLDSKKFTQNFSQPTRPHTNNVPAQQLHSSNAPSIGGSTSVESHEQRRNSHDYGRNTASLSATQDDFKEKRTVLSSNASLQPQIQIDQVASSSSRTLEISSPSPFIAQPGSVRKRRRQGAALVSNEEALNSRLNKIRKANSGGSNPSTPQQKSLLKQALKSSAPTSTPKRKHPKNVPSSKVATPSTGSKRKQITYEEDDEDSLKLEDLDQDPVAISQRLKKEQAEMPQEDGWLTPLSYHHKKRRLTISDEAGILGKEDVEPVTYVNPTPQIAPGSTSRNRIRMSGGTPLKEAQRREHQLHVTKAPTPLLRKPLSAEAVQTLISETLGDDMGTRSPNSTVASKGPEDVNGTPFALRKVKFADEAGGSLEAGPSPFGGVKVGTAAGELLAPPKFPGFGSADESKSVGDASGFSTSTPDAVKLGDKADQSIGGFGGFSTPSKSGDATSANGNLFVGLAETKAEESKSSDAPKTSISFGFGTSAPASVDAPAIGINASAAASETKSSLNVSSETKFPTVVESNEASAPKPAMSFSFGTPTPSSASSKPESTTNAEKPALSFGAPSNATPAVAGFSGFGTVSPKADSKPAISFGGFGAASSTATKDSETKSSGISFGGLNNPTTVKTAEPAVSAAPSATSFAGFGSLEKKDAVPAAGGFSFSTSAEPAAPATGGFSFGNTAASASSAPSDTAPKTGGFTFGNAAPAFSSAPAAAPSGFGATAAGTEPAKPSNGFSFGASNAAPIESSKLGGFSFGTPTPAKETTTAPPSFNFGAPSAASTNSAASLAAPASSFNFGSLGSSAATTTGSGFSMGDTATPAAAPFGAAPTSLSFGASSATPGFGAAPASQLAAPASGVQFGGLGAQNTQNAATPFGSAQASTGFGSAQPASSAAPFGTGAFGTQSASSGFGGFGSTGQTAAGAFGSTPAAAPAAFGTQNATSSFGAPASGFGGFGATTASAPPAATGGFGSAPSANSFGNGFAANSTPSASSSSFNFGSNSTTSAAPSSGSAPAFSFGNTSSSFGNPAPAAGASSFGGSGQSSSFQFGASNAPASTGTPFGAAPQSQPSFAFGSAPQQPQQGGFGFGSQAPAAPSSTAQAMFAFGSNAGGAAPASAPAGGGMFNLGSNSAAPENRMDRKLAQPKRPLGGRRPAAGTRPRLLSAALVASSLADTCETYVSGYCTRYVDYPVLVATGSSFSKVESVLKAGGMDLLLSLNASTPANRPCVAAFLEMSCYTVFPKCSDGVLAGAPCKSVCERVVKECTTLFTQFGKKKLLPDCAGNILNFEKEMPYPEEKCLGLQATATVGPEQSSVSGNLNPAPTAEPEAAKHECPSFLLKNPDYNFSNPGQVMLPVAGRQCFGPCCVPCPHMYQLYDPLAISGLNILFQACCLTSFLGALYTFLSYVTFAKRRVHPGGMMMYYALGATVCHFFQLFNLGSNGYRVGCVDEVTEALQSNSNLCIVQAFFLSAMAQYLTFWINLFMFNLHLQLVWRKDWFQDRMLIMHVLSILYTFIPPIAIIATNGVATIGFTCLASVHHAAPQVLLPMGIIGWPGVVVTVFTVVHLFRMLLSAPGGGSTNASSTNSSMATTPNTAGGKSGIKSIGAKSAAQTPQAPDPTKSGSNTDSVAASKPGKTATTNGVATAQTKSVKEAARLAKHRQKIWGVITKSWRSIAICVGVVVIYGSFWSFTYVIIEAFDHVSADTDWLQAWVGCALSGNSQSDCAAQVSPHIPGGVFIYMQQTTALIGTATAIIFGGSFYEDWKELLFKK